MASMFLNLESLEIRIAQFKSDPEKMHDINDFLNELFGKALKEVEHRRTSKQKKLDSLGIQNGSKRIGAWSSRARTSARSFASRVFTTLCNCTTSVRNVIVNRN